MQTHNNKVNMSLGKLYLEMNNKKDSASINIISVNRLRQAASRHHTS
jgi:hypothetical protein